MNPTGDDLTLAIDRLVDGDCPEPDRRALLLRLESEPDGWRRCALAFLEDQAIRSALGGPALSVAPEQPAIPRQIAPVKSTVLVHRLAVAAGLIAATFAAGFAAGGLRGRDPIVVAQTDDPKDPEPAVEAEVGIREVGWAIMTGGQDGKSPGYRVPILAGPGIDEEWLKSQPATVPDYVRAQWEREGFQVAENRRLMSLNLDDGRKLAIPVENLQVQYVGQNTY